MLNVFKRIFGERVVSFSTAELISQDSSELTKELEELLSLDNRPGGRGLFTVDG